VQADSSRTSHPIEVEIKAARSVQEIFDVISYQKGASVIKMISDFLGEKVFQKGLQTYLSEHAYGNTVTKGTEAVVVVVVVVVVGNCFLFCFFCSLLGFSFCFAFISRARLVGPPVTCQWQGRQSGHGQLGEGDGIPCRHY
jgi:hypothetical protein